ncbi:MAG: VWA domain-containing protein, partial [Candidatus Binataceae bacterium]
MFERPDLLWLLLATPLFALPGVYAIGRGRRAGGVLEATTRSLAYAALVILIAGLEFPAHIAARRMSVVAVMDESRSIAPDQLAWMRARVASLAGAMNPKDRLAVVGFGSDAKLLAPLGDPRLLGAINAPVNGGATDLESALTTALGIFPDATEKRLVLLSDGNQTEGDALSEAPALAADGVRIFAASPPPSSLPRVALTAVKIPPAVRAYERFAVRIDIENEAQAPVDGRLTLADNGRLAGEQGVTLRPGINRFELPYQIDHPGANQLSVALHVPRPVTATNAKADAAVSVLDTPNILIVSNDRIKSLADALRLRHYKVDETTSDTLSVNPAAYLSYQAIILGDITARSLRPGVQKALSHYVADLGGGLIATGGTMLDGKFKGSDLEKILPVTFRPQPPPPTREPVAVYLLIDRSNSMSYDSRDPEVRNFQRIRYAKRAAVALLNQLDDTDFAGVIAFDSQPYVLSHLRPVGEDRAQLVDRIERLQPGGGTDFKQALEIAEREILRSGLAVRQVILLTDGDTNREYHDHD